MAVSLVDGAEHGNEVDVFFSVEVLRTHVGRLAFRSHTPNAHGENSLLQLQDETDP